jgi:hypothetical protein
VGFEVLFTVVLGRPAWLEESRLYSKRTDHAQRLPEAELLAVAPVLVLVLGEQIPALAEEGSGGMRSHGANDNASGVHKPGFGDVWISRTPIP